MRVRSLALGLLLAFACRQDPALPRLFPVPDVQLVDETGATVRLGSLHGSVVVYDFIFTSCTGICPVMTNNMRALAASVDDRAPVRFVSISVDPERDTPAVLADYAKRVRNDPRWMFLTGERETVVRLSVDGFKLAAGDPVPGGEALLHSSRFAVADRSGTIRGYWDAADGAVVDELVRVVERLAVE